MADALVTSGTTEIALWCIWGISAAAALGFSIWGTLRVTLWSLGIPIKDRPAQHMLNTGLLVSFLNVVAASAVLARHFIWLRPDTLSTYVSYFPWVAWSICFALLSRAAALYLALNFEHREMVFYTAGLSCLALLPASFFNTYQYLWFAAHTIGFVYTIHLLWVYRRRPGASGVLAMLMMIVWPLCFTMPFGMGHAFGQYISFSAEMWWYFAGVLVGQLGLLFYMNITLFSSLTEGMERLLTRRFKSREECDGFPGDDSLAVVQIKYTSTGTTTDEVDKLF